MSIFKSKFPQFLGVRRFFVLSWLFCVLFGILPIFANEGSTDEKRRIGRVQATYLTHLINFTQWDKTDLPAGQDSAKILILGEDQKGIVEAFQFLVTQSKMKIEGRKVEVVHIQNKREVDARNFLAQKPQVVFFLKNSDFPVNSAQKISPQSLTVGNGREFVEVTEGDIAFVTNKNRIRLVMRKGTFSRKSPKLSSRISILRNVVEIVSKPR